MSFRVPYSRVRVIDLVPNMCRNFVIQRRFEKEDCYLIKTYTSSTKMWLSEYVLRIFVYTYW